MQSTFEIDWWIVDELETVLSTVCRSSILGHIPPFRGYQIHVQFNWVLSKTFLFLRLSDLLSFWLPFRDLI